MWKSYAHKVEFTGTLHPTDCEPCMGFGCEPAIFSPGAVITYPIPKCENCSGKGVPPIPRTEVGLR